MLTVTKEILADIPCLVLRDDRFTDRPMLFIDGGQDMDCPAAINAETVRLINEAGGQAEHFVDNSVGHEFSSNMRNCCIHWMMAHKEPATQEK